MGNITFAKQRVYTALCSACGQRVEYVRIGSRKGPLRRHRTELSIDAPRCTSTEAKPRTNESSMKEMGFINLFA